ncbi:hypothetical protein HN51_063122 [Arachis hypogaea]|uniref:Protein POLAR LOCALIZATION DURING ASYMMETRIC DIVISION AND REDISTRIBUTION n=1 Tax=Arachis hypogaea TaxID=3818 RepID=A0A445AZ86_ARAHY|nr:uncharacterized protein LOC107634539 [Arachis ipaensis]XP_025629455.1 uncharacterized protein LOC112722586 [Arachis hypogaea]QHO20722.1 uncharacterized protein DS421_11g340430 [Arachis hypogaea]RYR31762.1 hypothetical protein Ahy_B01g056656 [Arachis hypogaea]
MDFWVVVAGAGAGYLAKYWKRVAKSSDRSPHLSSEDPNLENCESPRSSFRGQALRDRLGKNVPLDRRISDANSTDGLSTLDLASNIGLDGEEVRHLRTLNDGDVPFGSNLTGLFTANGNYDDIEDGNEQSSNVSSHCGFLHPSLPRREVSSILNVSGNKTSLRTKRRRVHTSRPISSLESCLVAQLYKEHADIEERFVTSVSSPSRATGSFHVCDRSQKISSADDDDSSFVFIGSEENKLLREASQVKDENILFGVPPLPKIRSSSGFRKMRFNAKNKQSRRICSFNGVLNGKDVYTQHDATFLFSLGISFGILSTTLANKREMDKLRELLKKNENLVQDLQEELDMKDSMTVKELHSENYGSQDTCDHSFCDKELNGFSPEKHTDNSPITNLKKIYDEKEDENSECMSKIEAELEAELERLGLNMNESSLDRRLSELVEVDADFVADFAQGELRADMVDGEDFDLPKSNEDASDPMIVPANYAVSPHELSLRLHEVIQSRLEDRVQELELALQNSQRKLRVMESKHAGSSQEYFPSCKQASSFAKGNILTYDDCDPIAEPRAANLSSEALAEYNEAFEDSIKIDESEEHSLPSNYDSANKGRSHIHDWDVFGEDQHGGGNGSMTQSPVNGERLSMELSSSEVLILARQSSSVQGLDDVSGDEDCDCDSEMERQLIRQIVERTKKGSPVLQNARRILYSMDDDYDEH